MVRKLLVLSGIAILFAVVFHAAGWGYVAMFSWTHRYMPVTSPNYDQIGSLAYYTLRTIDQIVVFAIPAFLFVSGFFVAFATGRSQSTIGWETVRARVIKLLIPYLIWTFILFVLMLAEGRVFSPVEYLRMVLTGGVNPAYYYVPLLIQYYLLSPLIVYLAKKNWVALIVITVLIQVAAQLTHYVVIFGLDNPILQGLTILIPKWFFPSRIFWFALGVVIHFHLTDVKTWLNRYKWYLLGITIALIPLGIIEWEVYLRLTNQQWMDHRETVIDTIYTLTMILSFIAFADISIPFSKQLGDLGTKSYGVYLIHAPLLEYTARLIYLLAPWILARQLLLQPILIGVGVGIPLLLMEIVSRTPARRYYQYLYG